MNTPKQDAKALRAKTIDFLGGDDPALRKEMAECIDAIEEFIEAAKKAKLEENQALPTLSPSPVGRNGE